MRKIVIASKNPVKINAVKEAFESVFEGEEFELQGVSVNSEVPEQPIGDDQTYEGAYNRACNAQKSFNHADFWVGLEGGILKKNKTFEAFAWMVVLSKDNVGKSRTATFDLPREVSKLLDKGYELGEADDIVFKRSNSKQEQGAVGILTKGVVDRSRFYREAVILALIPFVNEELY